MEDVTASKARLRKYFLTLRAGMKDEALARLNEAILHRLQQLPELAAADTIHAFWPLAGRKEIDLRPLLKGFREAGKQIVLPVVLSFSDWQKGRVRMEHRLFEGETNLRPNRWEVHEPVETSLVKVHDLDAVIVPALAVDRQGYRLGYGKGYYDEFLATCRCPLICPTLASGLTDWLPTFPHDIPVDLIVTELEVIRINPT